MNELAGQLGLDKSSASGLIDRAQVRGLVRRVPSQRDRRSIRVRLTGPGRELAAEIDSLVASELATMLEPLATGQRSALASALGQLSAPDQSACARPGS
jgi:DNA-binding MarR family transcriptional regulator